MISWLSQAKPTTELQYHTPARFLLAFDIEDKQVLAVGISWPVPFTARVFGNRLTQHGPRSTNKDRDLIMQGIEADLSCDWPSDHQSFLTARDLESCTSKYCDSILG